MSQQGKTHRVIRECNAANLQLITIDIVTLVSPNWAKQLFNFFTDAIERGSCLIHITDLSSLFPPTHLRMDLYEALVLGMLLVKELSPNVFVIAETSELKDIHQTVIDLFDEVVEHQLPTTTLLETALFTLLEDDELVDFTPEPIATLMDGMNFRDIEQIYHEVIALSLRDNKSHKLLISQQMIIDTIQSRLTTTIATKGITGTKWSDIYGYDEIKELLRISITIPLTTPEVFKNLGVEPSKGVLLYGLSGTGKTYFAKAVATESGASFIAVPIHELVKGHVCLSNTGWRV
jgi:SpoVK/Ycf46/Vps4 family AAA+-type ATPase